MRLVTRKEFLKLPSGTAYCKGEKWYFDGMNFKGDTLSSGNDWYYLCPSGVAGCDMHDETNRYEKMLEGKSYPMEDAEMRDGSFNDEELFLVFEAADLNRLADMIEKAKAVS